MVSSGLVAWALAHALTGTLFPYGHCSRDLDHVIGPVLLTGTAAVATSFLAVAVAALSAPDIKGPTRRSTSLRTSVRWGTLPPAAFATIELVQHLTAGQPVVSAMVAATSLWIHITLGIVVAHAVQACTAALRGTLRITHAYVAVRHAVALSVELPPRCRSLRRFTAMLNSRGPPATGFCPALVPALARSVA